MVTGYTATEYGDSIITGLSEPYKNVEQVLGWNIVAGLTTARTTGTLSVVSGNTTINGKRTQFTHLTVGDVLIIGNNSLTISSITDWNTIVVSETPSFSVEDSVYYLQTSSNNSFMFEYRWSTDNKVFSEFRALNFSSNYGDLLSLAFDSTKPLYIEVKSEVIKLGEGNSLTFISMEFTNQTTSGVIESCPQFCVDCTDPFAYSGCANVVISDCNSSNLFKPYSVDRASKVYKEIVGLVSDIFGHESNYFRTEPDSRTEDVILMEYSLHNVVANDTIKILVPDNEFPEESALTYDIFGMGLGEFEVHISAAKFEEVFGFGKKPRSKDFMYIGIINKMYEISSVALADEFNKENSYWKVMLKKYQDRSSVIKGDYDAAADSLVTGIDEVFGLKQKEEQEKVSNPRQFQTITTSYRDGIRTFFNKGVSIVDYDLKNRWSVVSKNYYKLPKPVSGEIPLAIEYGVKSECKSGGDFAMSLWFSPQFASDSTDDFFLFGDGVIDGGLQTYISNTQFKIDVNGFNFSYTHGIALDKNKWYAVVMNFNNSYLQISLDIYELDPTVNIGTASPNRPQDNNNNLVNKFSVLEEHGSPLIWAEDSNYRLESNSMFMTNIRVFDKPIEEEEHSNILNQYVVRDNQRALLIDNAIPSLGFQKFANAR